MKLIYFVFATTCMAFALSLAHFEKAAAQVPGVRLRTGQVYKMVDYLPVGERVAAFISDSRMRPDLRTAQLVLAWHIVSNVALPVRSLSDRFVYWTVERRLKRYQLLQPDGTANLIVRDIFQAFVTAHGEIENPMAEEWRVLTRDRGSPGASTRALPAREIEFVERGCDPIFL